MTVKIILILSVIYVAGGIFLFLLQEKLLFHPRSLPSDHRYAFTQPFKEFNISQNGRNLHYVRFPAQGKKKGVVLYFHGNVAHLERYAWIAPFFTERQYELWMIDYPGFGKTTGKMSEQQLYADALKMYEEAMKEGSPDNIIIYGRSIGSGIAAQLASAQPSKELILETPYYSMTSIGKHYFPIYPAKMLLRYSLPVHQYISNLEIPITIFHGTKDNLIPYAQALKLKKEKPGLKLVSIEEGEHNNLFNYPQFKAGLDSILMR